MPTPDYAAKLARAEQELAEVQASEVEGQAAQAARSARIASLYRSILWYRPRVPRTTPIEHVGIGVGEDVTTSEGR